MSNANSPGHVFILHGDLRKIACDAWLMPCGIEARPEWYWWTEVERQGAFAWPDAPEKWGMMARRAFKLDPYPADLPQPYLVNVGGAWNLPISWYIDGVREFMNRVAVDLEGQKPRLQRKRHLIALPIVGTGAGGMRHRTGEVVRQLLPSLYEAAERYGFDIALVALDAPDYAAAQQVRLRYKEIQGKRWPSLSPSLREQADRLAQIASRGELVVFFGSGISQGAGLPTWGALLRELAEHPDQQLPIELEALSGWSYGDQARILEQGFGSRAVLGKTVVAHMQRSRHAIAHAMLAALPVQEYVTTNYDTLFEMASQAILKRPAVLPYESTSGKSRWVLKMHGCLEHPDDIVLTREDYLRYTARRSALAGIVQALLITKHMLFVGFSLDDDNFHRIADDVRKVVRRPSPPDETQDPARAANKSPLLGERPGSDRAEVLPVDATARAEAARAGVDPISGAGSADQDTASEEVTPSDGARAQEHGPFGTALLLHQRPFLAQIWSDEIQLVVMDDKQPATNIAGAARRLEIFLDYLLAQVHDPSYLLNDRFYEVLSPVERALRDHLTELIEGPEELRDTPAWNKVREMLLALGWRGY